MVWGPLNSNSAGGGHFDCADVFNGAIHYGLQFPGIFHFPASGEDNAGFPRIEPGGIAKIFVRTAGLADVQQKGFDDEFLNATRLPENALRVNIDVEVAGLNDSDGSGFFTGFALSGLAVRQVRFGGSLWERPLVAAIGIHEQELGVGVTSAITDSGYLQRQREAG